MLANNVQETTTTTGTGDITLAGLSENGRTFTSQFNLNERFTYFIDDGSGSFETGVGYLSASNILVRESVLDSSSNGNLVNFLTGTKQVFVGSGKDNSAIANPGFNDRFGYLKWMGSANHIQNNSSKTLQANQILYIPVYYTRATKVNVIGIRVETANGAASDNLYAGIYEIDPSNGLPERLMASATGFDPSTTGNQGQSITEIEIQRGWYFVGIWSDVTPVLRACSAQYGSIQHPFNAGTFDASNLCYYRDDGETGLLDLPQNISEGSLSPVINSPAPLIYVGIS